MATPNARMRLTVEVLPLTSENAHGPNRAAALAEFKGRKFALPVQLDHTFEQVWQQIEERYKKNYLSHLQASYFTIKKLQDAYDCDLDLRDTVGDIFEGETDPQMRMIKVVPSFVNRDFSMPPTSFLRPTTTHKRVREMSIDAINKRRRLEEQNNELIEEAPSRDYPITSTESARNISLNERASSRPVQDQGRKSRSRSGSSLVFVQNAQTGNAEYGVQIKEESPELGVVPQAPPPGSNGGFKKPLLPASKAIRSPLQDVTAHIIEDNESGDGETRMEMDSPLEDVPARLVPEDANITLDVGSPVAPVSDSQGAAIHESPVSTPGPTEVPELEGTNRQKNNFREESEAPFLHKSTTSSPRVTYSGRAKSSLNAAQFAQKAAHMLNGARPQSTTIATPKLQPQTPDKVAEASKTRQTQQQKSLSAPKNKMQWPSEDLIDISRARHTHTPVSSRKSTLNRKVRSASNLSTKRVNSRDHRDSVESLCSTNQAPERMDTSSPLTRRTPRRRSSPKVIVHVPTPSARTEPIPAVREVQESPEPDHAQFAANVQGTASHKVIESVNTQSTLPRRTPVPLPENVRHLAKAQLSRTNGTFAVATSRPLKATTASILKAASKRQNKKVSTAVGDAQASSITSTSPQTLPKPSRLRRDVYDVPSSESPPPRLSVPSIVPKGQPRKTPVPLPLNVRHIYGTNADTQRKATPSEEDSSTPRVVSPILNKRLTRASMARIGSASKASKEVAYESARKQTSASTKDGTGLSSVESSTTGSEGEYKNGRLQPKGATPASKGKQLRSKISSAEKQHKNVMKQMFPGGHENLRREMDTTRRVFGKRPPDPVRNFELSFTKRSDLDTLPMVNVETEASSTIQPVVNEKVAMDATGTHQTDEYMKQLSDAANEQIMQEEASGIAAAESATHSLKSARMNPSYNEDLDQPHEETTSKPQEEPAVGLERGDSAETDDDVADNEKSNTDSPMQSARSSPEQLRRPARYLSHSPTPRETDSEDDEQASSPRRATSSEPENEAAESKGNDSTDSSTDENDTPSENSGAEQDDADMPDVDKTEPPSTNPQPSSPPQAATQPITLVPATQDFRPPSLSQPLPSGTPAAHAAAANTPVIPASQPTPSFMGSSQSISQLAAARRAAYSKFPSVKQQLQAARTSSASSQNSKPFDPRTTNLAKLAKRTGRTFDVSDSSSDEASSSSSASSEVEDKPPKKKKGKNPFCSVA